MHRYVIVFNTITVMSLEIISKEYADSTFASGPVVKTITSLDGSVSVFTDGPNVDLRVKSGGGGSETAYGFRLYLCRSTEEDMSSSVAYCINECIRPIMKQWDSGYVYAAGISPECNYMCYKQFDAGTEFPTVSIFYEGPVTVLFDKNSELPVNSIIEAVRYRLLAPGEYIEFITTPLRYTDM